MAWTAPMTAVATAVFTASQFNTHIRDNLIETEAGTARTSGGMFFSAGTNDIAERIPTTARVDTDQSTTSTSFADLATVGPAVSVNTRSTVIVFYSAGMYNSGANNINEMSFAVSGATTIAASSVNSVIMDGIAASNIPRLGGFAVVAGLTEGTNTFTAKYKVSAGTGNFFARELFVLPT